MFERFTEGARQVVALAQEEAVALGHNYIGTEHLLLGLLREDEGVAARVLASLGMDVEGTRVQVARIVGEGTEATFAQIPFTPRTKKVLELALRESLRLGDDYIGSGHLLLGLVREGEGVANRILRDAGAEAAHVRKQVVEALAAGGAGSARAAKPPARPGDGWGRPAPTPASFAQALARALERAASAAGDRAIDTGDLLVALLEQRDGVIAAAVERGEVDVDALRTAIEAARERGA